jgi:hypothetical protein
VQEPEEHEQHSNIGTLRHFSFIVARTMVGGGTVHDCPNFLSFTGRNHHVTKEFLISIDERERKQGTTESIP